MSNVIACALQKGGTGKTTTTLNLGVELSKLGFKVLLIDIDPQANLTSGLGFDPEELRDSIYDVLLNASVGAGFAIHEVMENLDLIPSKLALAGAELELAGFFGRELLLKEALEPELENYDFILIDPPPSLGIFTMNSLVAAGSVITPLQAQTYAFRAMPQLEATIKLARKLNPSLKVSGILLTMVDRRTSLSPAIERQAREKYGELVFKTTIPDTTKLAEAPTFGEPISTYAPSSPAAKAYEALALEVKELYHA
jgi:chromosome partitioning protein